MKEMIEKLENRVICDEKVAVQMEVEKQVEVQRSLAAEVADKSVLVEKIRMRMQQELKNNQEVLEEEVMVKLVMTKEKEAVEKELKKTAGEKKAIEREMLKQNEVLGQNKSRLKTVDATLRGAFKKKHRKNCESALRAKSALFKVSFGGNCEV